jgi:hypothetical protein
VLTEGLCGEHQEYVEADAPGGSDLSIAGP